MTFILSLFLYGSGHGPTKTILSQETALLLARLTSFVPLIVEGFGVVSVVLTNRHWGLSSYQMCDKKPWASGSANCLTISGTPFVQRHS